MIYSLWGIRLRRVLVALMAVAVFAAAVLGGMRLYANTAHAGTAAEDLTLTVLDYKANAPRGAQSEYLLQIKNNSATDTHSFLQLSVDLSNGAGFDTLTCESVTGTAMCPTDPWALSPQLGQATDLELPPASSMTFRYKGKYPGDADSITALVNLRDYQWQPAATQTLVTTLTQDPAARVDYRLTVDNFDMATGLIEYRFAARNVGGAPVEDSDLKYTITLPDMLTWDSAVVDTTFEPNGSTVPDPQWQDNFGMFYGGASSGGQIVAPAGKFYYSLPDGGQLVARVSIQLQNHSLNGCGTPPNSSVLAVFNPVMLPAYPAQNPVQTQTQLPLPPCSGGGPSTLPEAVNPQAEIALTAPMQQITADQSVGFNLSFSNPGLSTHDVQAIQQPKVRFMLHTPDYPRAGMPQQVQLQLNCDTATSNVPCPPGVQAQYQSITHDNPVFEVALAPLPKDGVLRYTASLKPTQLCGEVRATVELLDQQAQHVIAPGAQMIAIEGLADVACAQLAVTNEFVENPVAAGTPGTVHTLVSNAGSAPANDSTVTLTFDGESFADVAAVTCVEATGGAVCPTGLTATALSATSYRISLGQLGAGQSYKLAVTYNTNNTAPSDQQNVQTLNLLGTAASVSAIEGSVAAAAVSTKVTYYHLPGLACAPITAKASNHIGGSLPGALIPGPVPPPAYTPDDEIIDEGLGFASELVSADALAAGVLVMSGVDPNTIHPTCKINPDPPKLVDPCGPDNASYEFPYTAGDYGGRLTVNYSNANKTVEMTIAAPYYFTDGERTKTYNAVDANQGCDDVVIPAAPLVDDPCGPDNATWVIPADTDKYTWRLNSNSELLVETKLGYSFEDGTTEHNYGKAPDANVACAAGEISAPPLPLVGGLGDGYIYAAAVLLLFGGGSVGIAAMIRWLKRQDELDSKAQIR